MIKNLKIIFGVAVFLLLIWSSAKVISAWLGGGSSLTYEAHALSTDLDLKTKISSYLLTEEPERKLPLSAGAYLVSDLDLDEPILKKNESQVLPIASITKLMTTLTARELLTPDYLVEISRQAWETYGNTGNLRVGDKIPLEILFYPLLLSSSNDAAEAIALSAGRERFMHKMNDLAKAIGMTQTHFADPSGLSPENISTPEDLVKLLHYLYKKEPDILDMTSLKSYRWGRYNWTNHNRVALMKNFFGGKNGYTDEANRTLVSLFEVPVKLVNPELDSGNKKNRLLAVVLLQSDDNRSDANKLFTFIDRYVAFAGGKNGFIPILPAVN